MPIYQRLRRYIISKTFDHLKVSLRTLKDLKGWKMGSLQIKRTKHQAAIHLSTSNITKFQKNAFDGKK